MALFLQLFFLSRRRCSSLRRFVSAGMLPSQGQGPPSALLALQPLAQGPHGGIPFGIGMIGVFLGDFLF
jgi:hypothetical protein